MFIGIPLLTLTYQAFPLTPLTYRLLTHPRDDFGHRWTLYVCGGSTRILDAQDMFEFSRNHYDRIGHVAQGFIPAILAREILLRCSPLTPGKWTFFLVTSICLAFSALYELFEWGMAQLTGEAATAFLGTQGDDWDTQWDMFLALLGAITSQLLFGKLHDKHLAGMK